MEISNLNHSVKMSMTHAKASAILHKADSRGLFDYGWLQTCHSFSFSSYYNPHRLGFGTLRVLNDDTVAANAGFSMHEHKNMEIISIPLSGELQHEDSNGNKGIITAEEVQVMSAGSGIEHSEMNPSKEENVSFLQIWIIPREKDLQPSYDQKRFETQDRKNNFQLLVSGDGREDSLQIGQDAFISRACCDEGCSLVYKLKGENNLLYIFNLSGTLEISGNLLNERDALAISQSGDIEIKAEGSSDFLVIEVPK